MPRPAEPPPAGWRALVRRYWWAVGFALAAAVVLVLAPLASSDPDGLEKVAGDKQFLGASEPPSHGLLPDYSIPGLGGDLSTVLAGLVGVAIVAALIVVAGRLLVRRPR